MAHLRLKAAAAVTLAALIVSGSAAASTAAEPGPAAPTPLDLPDGRYIVLLDEKPVATYEGGEPGLAPTKAKEGERLDAASPQAKQYSRFLQNRQKDVASSAGVTPDTTYQITLNGFSANLSGAQASKLKGTKGVLGVYADEVRHPDAVPSTQFLGLEGAGGVWEGVGGIDKAGAGIVVGVVDTGISPENPSFAGDPLSTTPSDTQPYLAAGTDADGAAVTQVVYKKSDGGEFRSTVVDKPGAGKDAWSAEQYSTKLVGAQYFSEGAAATGFSFAYDYLSPRDGAGHGSHTASTAAGNNGVDATVEGVAFGAISGVAPAAKVAAYKACYDGPDPLVTTDDICALSDLLGAIDQATADGVDVINYSIGGGSATSVLQPDDISFYNAAAAGVFVSVSAGNSGPDASTADHASPWYTTVAASTIPTWEGTVELPNGFQKAGASVSVPFGERVTGPVVYSGDVALAGNADAPLCYLGSLDPAKVAGKIVVCDRGSNARVEKSQAVKEAGGIGMILVNVTPGSLDNDFHSVPTVHLPDTDRTALLDYVRGTADATATLIGENVTGVETPTPQVAGFSSRGPMLADGSDVIKPDISAPGVAILAATNNAPGADPTFGILSGTSMAAPHIAGLAALYLGERPNATPAEIKSAMMTTAYDTKDAAGAAVTDPFTQGAGHVDPTAYFSPSLLYLNGPADWAAYLQGLGLHDFGVSPIDASDLNLASIGIGSLAGSQTVTRTITATEDATFTANVDLPGFDVTVAPSTVSLKSGEKADVKITVTRTDAPVEKWTHGFLRWTGGTHAARSPIAVYPVSVDAPASVSGTGISGTADVTVTPAVTGDLDLAVSGLAPATLLTDPDLAAVPGHSGDQDTFSEEDGQYNAYMVVDVPQGSTYARFDVDSSDDTGSDLDLTVYRVVSPTDWRYYENWSSATSSADESVALIAPTAGTYLVQVNRYAFTSPFTWDATAAVVGDGAGVGSLTASPDPLPTTSGQPATYTLSWSGLDASTRYFGIVRYGDSAATTVLTVDSGAAAPVATAPPTVTGTPKVGSTLTATGGTWNPADVTLAYQWLRDGSPIDGATGTTYKVTKADAGTTLSVRVTATAASSPNAGTADSAGVVVKASSSLSVTVNPYLGRTSTTFVVNLAVKPSHGPAATGAVTVWVDGRKYTADLADGKASITLPKQSRGVHLIVAQYGGSAVLDGSFGASGFLVF
ncbi:MAG: S8 family serine peptidase [Microbacterium ginsengisoli]|uniref:S8 family serine peptidase n=2 Tax=Microbacteriaceae TaxID=85023 RepID=UPI0006FFC99A|nr:MULTISPECIES: S8 family serine peptidase [unclassified Microbacterium]KQR91674.1 hypothetical protein ASF93_07145 [Microbacterium sp. Leaf347]MBN9197843.1 S8 family serine peptidase [Microbacterium ginsengisoli]OJU79258.1 MAG: hypothetical protein BGO15_10055 [Microbacterium sp. 71-23]